MLLGTKPSYAYDNFLAHEQDAMQRTMFLMLAPMYLKLIAYFICSVSSLMTTTEAIIVEIPKEEKEAPAMGGMGGMDY